MNATPNVAALLGTAIPTRMAAATDLRSAEFPDLAELFAGLLQISTELGAAGPVSALAPERLPVEAPPPPVPDASALQQLMSSLVVPQPVPTQTVAPTPASDDGQDLMLDEQALRLPVKKEVKPSLGFIKALDAGKGAESASTPTDVSQLLSPVLPAGRGDLQQESGPSLAVSAVFTSSPVQQSVGVDTSTGRLELPASSPVKLEQSVGSARWAEELGGKLSMMSVRGQREATLTLTPEHLGPLEVRISSNQDLTNVWFGAAHADTRAALAEAIPRLRELFSAAGLSLGQASVSQESPRGDSRAPQHGGLFGDARSDADGLAIPVSTAGLQIRGLIDTYV
jgi:flagellar hook-length control protein FliK